MKDNKILLAVVLLAGIGVGLNYRDTRALRALLKNREAQAETRIQDIEKANAVLYVDNAEKDKKIALATTVIEGLRSNVVRATKEKDEAVARLKAAPPEELLRESRRILKTEEIWLRGAGAEFSLAAFRDNTTKLVEWESFSLTIVPKLAAENEWKDRKILAMDGEIVNLKTIDVGRQQQIEAVRGVVKDLKDYIKIENRKGMVNTLLKVGAGILIGYAIGR